MILSAPIGDYWRLTRVCAHRGGRQVEVPGIIPPTRNPIVAELFPPGSSTIPISDSQNAGPKEGTIKHDSQLSMPFGREQLVQASSASYPTHFLFDHNGRQREIRTVTWQGGPAFVAKDVAEALGYVWAGSATTEQVPEEWKGVNSVLTPSGKQEMAVLSEPALYFFLGRSDKPAALPMQKWVAGEVLPAIRRDGGYMVARPEETPEELALRAVTVLQATIERQKAELAAAPPEIETPPGKGGAS